MQSEFRFTRHGCGPRIDAFVRLSAVEALEFSVQPGQELDFSPEQFDAVAFGVRSGHSSVAGTPPLAVTVEVILDHSGTTSPLGFKICAEAAMLHLLGLPDRAPFPGYVLGEA